LTLPVTGRGPRGMVRLRGTGTARPASGDGVDQRSDAALLLASRDDPAAFVELYRRHAEDLLRYFARRTLDPEVAAELTAETFAEAFASRARYSYVTGVNGVAWLYWIARHQLGRFFRSGRIDATARKRSDCRSVISHQRTTNESRTSRTARR